MTNFSVVTVVYNDISHIMETMNSVIGQSYKQIEYILIDGGSTDGTKEKIIDHISSCANITLEASKDERYYLEAIHKDHSSITFKFLSEKDKGIFDAMNKGIDLATGNWINFLNCGDRFYSLDVLQQMSNRDLQNYDVLYGDLEVLYLDQKTKIIKKTSHDLKKLYALFAYFGHPNCFVKTKILKSNLFDPKYHLSADYDLIYRLYQKDYRFGFTDIVVATFLSCGASDKKANQSLKEALDIALKYNEENKKVWIKIYLFYWFARFKKVIKLSTPSFFGKLLLKMANEQ